MIARAVGKCCALRPEIAVFTALMGRKSARRCRTAEVVVVVNGFLLDPMIAGVVMALRLVSVVANRLATWSTAGLVAVVTGWIVIWSWCCGP